MMPGNLQSLFSAMESVDRLLILTHNDPDPDAIASAVALRQLLVERLDMKAHIAYQGLVGRVENRALVRYLSYPLRLLAEMEAVVSMPVALVDTQPGAGNNALPPESEVVVVFDHHPLRETISAAFADVRPDVGATSTILTEYLQAANVEPEPSLATALFYGIKTDTMGLGRGTSQADVAAYFYLQSRIDVEALVQIERAQLPAEYFEGLVTALRATRIYDGVVISYLGPMRRSDLAAEIADLLLRLQGARWVICMGVFEDELILSVRTQKQGGAGQLIQDVVGDRGSAGGHGSMAAGQVPLREESPLKLASLLRKRALARLEVSPETKGEPLIRC